MAHASVRKDDGTGGYDTETGWADGDRVTDKGSWATQVTLTVVVDCDDGTEPPTGHADETAFAWGDTCFLDIDADGDGNGDFNRWGWTIGPLSPDAGTLSSNIYAGAGQCDLTKGTLVGELTVDYEGSTVTVTYTADAGYHFDETHLYVGNEILPRDVNGNYTVAPGQYSEVDEYEVPVTTVTYVINDVSGTIHVVAHAVAGPL
jgi:hypothetical protein